MTVKSSSPPLPPLKSVKLLDQLRERIRYLHYSIRTEDVYVYWVRTFLRFHGRRHPATMGAIEVEAFLSWLVNTRHAATSTHKQALSALLFFYRKVLGTDLPWMTEIGRPRTKRRLPVVLSPDEVARILCLLDGEHRLFAQLLYGTGMRINEGLQLRVKDIDFGRGTIIVREGKGGKDRAVMLPQRLGPGLHKQLARARVLWQADQAAGRGGVAMPDALDRKYPRAGRSWMWFWVFPQDTYSVDPRSGVVRRHHMYDQTFQRAFKRALVRTGIAKPATPHPSPLLCDGSVTGGLRHSNGPGAPWPCRCEHDDDLHPCTEGWWRRSA
jgi:integron integrase